MSSLLIFFIVIITNMLKTLLLKALPKRAQLVFTKPLYLQNSLLFNQITHSVRCFTAQTSLEGKEEVMRVLKELKDE